MVVSQRLQLLLLLRRPSAALAHLCCWVGLLPLLVVACTAHHGSRTSLLGWELAAAVLLCAAWLHLLVVAATRCLMGWRHRPPLPHLTYGSGWHLMLLLLLLHTLQPPACSTSSCSSSSRQLLRWRRSVLPHLRLQCSRWCQSCCWAQQQLLAARQPLGVGNHCLLQLDEHAQHLRLHCRQPQSHWLPPMRRSSARRRCCVGWLTHSSD